jgi:hypothetical protein
VVALAAPTELQRHLLGDPFGDVHFGAETRHAHVRRVWLDGAAALAAQTAR